MADHGITDAGFIPYTQADILIDLQSKAALPEYFGAEQDLSIFDPAGQQLALMADMLGTVWQGLEDSYYSVFPATASGVSLDRAVSYGGVGRKAAQSATVVLTASGTNGTSVPVGSFNAQTAQGIKFQNLSSGIVASGIVSLFAKAIVPGLAGIVPAGAINLISTPFTGITKVTNPSSSYGGSEIESDVDMRYRFDQRSQSGGSSLTAIQGALANMVGVTAAFVEENVTDGTVGGLPPHSIHCVVGGYANAIDIANMIFSSKAGGIQTYGATSAVVTDANGDPHTIYWDTPTQKLVNVKVLITSNSLWTSSNNVLVETAVIQAIGGVDTIGTVSTQYAGGGMSADVYSWKLESIFDSIVGIEDVTVYLAFYPTTPTSLRKLSIAAAEFAWCDNANITIAVS